MGEPCKHKYPDTVLPQGYMRNTNLICSIPIENNANVSGGRLLHGERGVPCGRGGQQHPPQLHDVQTMLLPIRTGLHGRR